jgi:hypothetical protein
MGYLFKGIFNRGIFLGIICFFSDLANLWLFSVFIIVSILAKGKETKLALLGSPLVIFSSPFL